MTKKTTTKKSAPKKSISTAKTKKAGIKKKKIVTKTAAKKTSAKTPVKVKKLKKVAPKAKKPVKVSKPKSSAKKPLAVKTPGKKTLKETVSTKKIPPKKPLEKKVVDLLPTKSKKIEGAPKKKRKQHEHKIFEEDQPNAAQIRAEALKKIKGYSKGDLEHFKKIILEKRDEIVEQLQNLREQMLDPTTGEYINENSPYSLHMAEQGTDAMEREKTFLYAQRENKFLGYLEDALKRIEAGTYGICVDCIEQPQHLCDTCPLVPKARLEAVPHSQLCLPIKQKQEKHKTG
ncbi:MAG: conjugal transfer protein TraR [Ignavibacteria bacterium CG2_30_36_16]|nr:MAG: conjugal transfer protein TraR [Ignavibacteria bacterium CG2_30_36_16]